MAQHFGPDRAGRSSDRHRAPRLAALLALAVVTGIASALLAVRVLALVDDLPGPRFETYLEVPLVGAGSLLAAWVSGSSALAAWCVLVRAAGRRWAAGERLVLRHAPVVVRRLASAGVAVSMGAGLALGAGSAQAAETDPAGAATSPAVVDLGWQSSAGEPSGTPGSAHPTTGPDTVPVDPASPGAPTLTDPGSREAPSDPGASTPGQSQEGRQSGQGERPVPTVDRPTEPSSGPAVDAPAQSPSSSAPPPVAAPRPDHVPLGGLLGGSQRTAPPPPAAPRPDAPAQAGAGRDIAPPPVAESGASAVSIVVLRGDSLWSLARRALGQDATDAQVTAEWERWYAANSDVIGHDPDLIRPGQVLQVPSTT